MHQRPVASWVRRSVMLWLTAGCATAPVARPDPSVLARADAELMQGCYDCLRDAQATYRRLAVGPARAALAVRVFEADLLLAVREKELGLPASDALDEARRIADELPRETEGPRYVALVDAVPPEQLGVPRRAMVAHMTAHAPRMTRPDERSWLAAGALRAPVRDYLKRAIDCVFPVPGATATPPPPPSDAPPLIAYRAASCGLGPIDALAAVRAREPRFVETAFFIAQTALVVAGRDGEGQARALLAEAQRKFPESPAIRYLAASYEQLAGNFAGALALYDQTLIAQPHHERALLGRVSCLSHLDRPQEAIAAATLLIALGAENAGEAYYWRAWNHHKRHQLVDARSDIGAAKQRIASADVLSLAGIIEHDQSDLDPAEADLEAALAMSPQDCTAHWYLGLVHRQRKRWPISARTFETAMICYRERATDNTEKLSELQARTDLDAVYRTQQVTALQASIDADGRQQHLCALVAASHHTTAGDLAAAQRLLDLTGDDPALAERVAKLRAQLDTRGKLNKARTKPAK